MVNYIVIHLPLVVQVVDHGDITLTLLPYLVPGNSNVIVMLL